MSRIQNKENSIVADGALDINIKQHQISGSDGSYHHVSKLITATTNRVSRKRALEETNTNGPVEDLVANAKRAIKRKCAEMGIQKHTSLAAKPATVDTRNEVPVARRVKRVAGALNPKKNPFTEHAYNSLLGKTMVAGPELSSEATVVSLPSEGIIPYDEEGDTTLFEPGTPRLPPHYDDELLDSQLTLIAPSSPILSPRAEKPEEEVCRFVPKVRKLTSCKGVEEAPKTYEELGQWMHKQERRYIPSLEQGISRHPELSAKMRPILVDWLMEVATDYRMHRQTLHLTIQYLDRFLARTPLQVKPNMLQCYGTACISLAMKAEEQRVPRLSELTDFSKGAFTRSQLRQAEIDVLSALGWHLSVPTLFEFLCIIFQQAALHAPEKFGDSTAPDNAETTPKFTHGFLTACPATTARSFDAQLFMAACDYADTLMHCQRSLKFKASELAAACFYLGTAPSSLKGSTFVKCTGYSFSDIIPVIMHIKRLRSSLDPQFVSPIRAKQCCKIKDRYATHLKRIRPAELWAFQPHHAHLLQQFEDAPSS